MTTTKKRTGPWKRGESGNPAGRPRGSGHVAKLRESIAADVPDIIKSLTLAAKGGDVAAARLLLERVCPPIRASEEAAPIDLQTDGPLAAQGRAILAAAAAGELSAGQAGQMLGGLAALGKLIETDELEARIAALEGKPDATR